MPVADHLVSATGLMLVVFYTASSFYKALKQGLTMHDLWDSFNLASWFLVAGAAAYMFFEALSKMMIVVIWLWKRR